MGKGKLNQRARQFICQTYARTCVQTLVSDSHSNKRKSKIFSFFYKNDLIRWKIPYIDHFQIKSWTYQSSTAFFEQTYYVINALERGQLWIEFTGKKFWDIEAIRVRVYRSDAAERRILSKQRKHVLVPKFISECIYFSTLISKYKSNNFRCFSRLNYLIKEPRKIPDTKNFCYKFLYNFLNNSAINKQTKTLEKHKPHKLCIAWIQPR